MCLQKANPSLFEARMIVFHVFLQLRTYQHKQRAQSSIGVDSTTAFTYTDPVWFGYQGTVTKRSMNEAEQCQTNLPWDLLTEPGQHGSVRLFVECKHFYNCA